MSGARRAIDNDVFEAGTAFCCDAPSPHILMRDPRIVGDLFYLAISMDSATPLAPTEVIERVRKSVPFLCESTTETR